MTLAPPPTRQTILVVDDTPENLTVLGELLQASYQVRVARSGARALQVVASRPRPDLILLDVMMPDMDGYTVLRQLRNDPSTQDIPVIFVTAMDGIAEEIYGLDMGAVDYITKPICPAIVLARVHTQLELKQARDLLRNQNAYLEAEVARRMRENQLIQDVSIRALASLAEARDLDTKNHLRRTQAYVKLLAETIRHHPRFAAALTDQSIEVLVKSAPLHDIGKVGIPDSILFKPDKLNADEWAIMRSHCQIGSDAIKEAMQGALNDEEYQALQHKAYVRYSAFDLSTLLLLYQAPLAFLNVAQRIALSHHEKWDGSGYPEGLVGDAIPIAARLMAVADVFDALRSRRVYKPPLPMEQVTQMIVEQRGRHFDPDIVEVFIDQRREFQTISERYTDNEEATLYERSVAGPHAFYGRDAVGDLAYRPYRG